MKKIQVELTHEELESVISALLFTSSISIIGSVDEVRQQQLVGLAQKLKTNDPKIKLKFIEFIQEEQYEDECSQKIYEEFKNNLNVVTFEGV